MKNNKKSILMISALLVVALAFMFMISKFEAHQGESVFKTADGSIVKIVRDDKSVIRQIDTVEVAHNDEADDGEIYYGKIIKHNGSVERVYAISEDGSFMTEVLENEDQK